MQQHSSESIKNKRPATGTKKQQHLAHHHRNSFSDVAARQPGPGG